MTTRSRGSVAVMTAPSAVRCTSLIVSMAGIPAMAAPYFRAAVDDVVNDFGSHKGTDRIMHQHNIVGSRRDCANRIGHGLLAVLAALHQFNLLLRKVFVGLQAGAKPGDLVGSQGHIDFRRPPGWRRTCAACE